MPGAKQVVLKVTAKGAKVAKRALKGVGSVLKGIGSAAAGVTKATAIMGAGFAALSTKLAGDFQKNLLEVSTLMDTNAFNMKKMSAELRNAAGASGLALSSLSKAKYDIVSAGFGGVSDSAKVLNTSMQLAVGGVTSAAEAADLLTSSINAYGLKAKDSQKISDSLFVTVQQGKTTINQLAQSLGQVLPFAKAMNLSIDGVGASMAVLTAAGINTAEATTALKGTITGLTAPGKAAKAAMEEAGISVKRFADGSVDLVQTMAQFEGMDSDALSKFVPNVRAQLGILTMANNMEALREKVGAFDEAATNVDEFGNAISETEVAFKKMRVGFNNQMASLINNAQSGMILVGDAIMKVIQPKIEAVNKLFEKIGAIGWDVVAQRIEENSDTIMRIMQLTFTHGLNIIKANVRVLALELGQEIQTAILGRFATDMTDQITKATEDAKTITEMSITSIKNMSSSLFALLTREKEEEVKTFKDGEEGKVPVINKVTTVLSDQADQIDDITTKETARYATSINGIRGLIKGYYAQMLAKAVMGEADKGFWGIVTGSLVAAGFASLFDSVVPQFAQGGIVPGSGNQDTVPAMLTPGELILNQSQQENLAGGMNNVTVNISAPLVDEHILDTIIPAINNAVRSNSATVLSTQAIRSTI